MKRIDRRASLQPSAVYEAYINEAKTNAQPAIRFICDGYTMADSFFGVKGAVVYQKNDKNYFVCG
jgi:hypothetical protein